MHLRPCGFLFVARINSMFVQFSKYQIELNCKLERQELLLSDMEEEEFEGPVRASPPNKHDVLIDN
jgi:hypothetical protein